MKYMGSKNRIAKHILPIILKDRKEGQCYVEPFVGGANMIDKVEGWRIGSDSNGDLIALLDELSKGWEPPTNISKDMYKSIKSGELECSSAIRGWAGICCSYSGKWFGGYAGIVTTKEGVRDYILEAYDNVMKQAGGLGGIQFVASGYQDLEIPDGSIIYCDPPYAGTTKYKDGFDHDEFWKWCRDKSKGGHQVFVSEYCAPDDFICVWEKEVKSSLSANGKVGGNKASTEKLFVHESQINQ